MVAPVLEAIRGELTQARREYRLRELESRDSPQRPQVRIGGRTRTNFTSNDYLGLAAHPLVVKRVREELARSGFGAGSAALLSGRSAIHAELERALADYTGMENGLLFSSGYLANLGALGALVGRQDFVAHDRLNHASLIDAVTATGARHRRYPHGELPRFDSAPAGAARQRWLVTESLFSMDGDVPDLAALDACAAEAQAALYVDDAHGIGVLNGGRGAAAVLPPDGAQPRVLMATLGKAFASVGAVVLGPALVIDWLVQRARTFVYDTALPPVCAAAALAALEICRNTPSLHQRLADNIRTFREHAVAAAVPLAPGTSPIQPVMLGSDERALAVAAALDRRGFYVRAIRPPTVPRGTARLRVTLTAAHDAADIEHLVNAIAETLRDA